ncbi:MAG TPA: 5'-3' exonuclease H3TH domain-containing protein [bacterium]|nr:5'-3' exonuclease H3TH domain-containing protein [bacterium]
MKTLVLIDSNAVIHRAYHALPKNLSNTRRELTNVTYGFALALIKILEELKPDFVAAAFDLAGPTFRHVEYKEYKATRVKADQELYDQIPRVREMLIAFGIPIYAVEGFEADDIIGTIVDFCNGHNEKCKIPGEDLLVYIASGDRDVYQLLNGHSKVFMLKHGFSEAEIFDTKHLKEVYNLEPTDFIDLKALMGDASDNIPGIPGIGPKTATDLLIKFDTLEKLYEKIAKLLNCSIANLTEQQFSNETIVTIAKQLGIKERILKLLIEHKEQAFMSQRLATIRRDVPIDFNLADARWGQYDKEKVRALFEELEFRSLLRRFTKGWEGESAEKKVTEEQKKKDKQLKLEL